jgi:molecular chaperone GrpE (heat shock protein)
VTSAGIEGSVRSAVESLYIDNSRLREQLDDMNREHRRDRDALLREVIEIADGVERLRMMADAESGMQLGAILLQLEEFLTGQGLSAFRPAIGDSVDGRDSEVMATITGAGLRPGMVTRVLRPGYRQAGRMVRRAGVETVKE